MYKLTVRKGPQQGQSYPLVSSMVTVGRDPMADIVIADPEVSRQHARFTRTAGGYEIQDLGSTNGTFVDGQRLTGDPVRLQSGQVISMGTNVTLVFEAAADPMATVVSSEPELDIPEPPAAEEEHDQPAPDEAPDSVPDTGPFAEEEPDAGATALEFPTFEEEEASPEEEAAFGEAGQFEEEDPFGQEEGERPSFDEPEIPEPAPYEPTPQEQTILDAEPDELGPSSFGYEQADEEAGELPSFGAEQPSHEPPAQRPIAETHDELPPPPASPPEPPADDKGNRNLIIGVVVLLFLCCCCLLISAWFLGDPLLRILQDMGLM